MSRAHVREVDGDEPEDLPELPLSQHPNYVTARGLAQLEARREQIEAEIAAIAADAAAGFRDVTVTTADSTAAILSGFQVVVPTAAATGIAPNSARAGATGVAVLITGTGFSSPATVAFSGDGITVRSVTVDSATQITAIIDLDRNAAISARMVTVTVGGSPAGTLAFQVLQRRGGGAAGLVLLIGLGTLAGLRRRQRRG